MKNLNTFAKFGIATTMAFGTVAPIVTMMAPIHAEEIEAEEAETNTVQPVVVQEQQEVQPVYVEPEAQPVQEQKEEQQPTCGMWDTHNIENLDIQCDEHLVYNGYEQIQNVKFMINNVDQNLLEDVDYKLEGNKATEPGTYTMTVKGINNYHGEAKVKFTIEQRAEGTVDINEATIKLASHLEANGHTQTQKVKVTYDGKKLVEGKDYILQDNKAKKAGYYEMLVIGTGEKFTGSAAVKFEVKEHKKVDLNKTVIQLANQLTENGQAQAQKVVITYGNLYLEEGIDFVLTNNVATSAGTYTMTITAVGNDFQGQRQVNYTVAAKKEEKKQEKKEDKKEEEKNDEQGKGGNEKKNNVSTNKKADKKVVVKEETNNNGMVFGFAAIAVAGIAAMIAFFKKFAK